MRIGELSEASGLSRDCLRFYERSGLLAARRSGNSYRDYPAESLPRLLYIKTAQQLGFSLTEIASQLTALAAAPDQDAAISLLLADKLLVVERKMAELAAIRAELQARIGQACPLRPQHR